MIQIGKSYWIKSTEVMNVWVEKDRVHCEMLNNPDIVVDKAYLNDFCSAVHVPYNTILSLLDE